jgi:membrane protease YdiL (CAAX protease family)
MYKSFIGWIKAHELWSFFILTFLITFAGWVPVFLGLKGSDIYNTIGLWGPALSAILVTALSRGRAGFKELFQRLLHWRVPVKWYLIILLGWPAVSLLALVVYSAVSGQPLTFAGGQWSQTAAWLVQSPLLAFWACEELGWRGFAQPRLQGQWNALLSSVILGVIWACWHLPYYLVVEMPTPFYFFMIFTISVSILMTWILNHTRGSVFIATVFHFWINIWSAIQADKFPTADPGRLEVIQDLVIAAAAILVVALFGYRSLTRSQAPAPAMEAVLE